MKKAKLSNIRVLKNVLRLSTDQVAEDTGFKRSTISSWENGNSSPRTADWLKLINYLNDKVSEIVPEGFQYRFSLDYLMRNRLTSDDARVIVELIKEGWMPNYWIFSNPKEARKFVYWSDIDQSKRIGFDLSDSSSPKICYYGMEKLDISASYWYDG